MANTVRLKRSAVQGKTPTTSDLQLGELALNTYDGKLYTKKDDGTASIVEIGAGGGGVSGDIAVDSAAIGLASTETNTTLDVSGAYSGNVVSVAALNIDCSAGNYFTKAISSNSTFTFSNIPTSGTAYSFTLEVDVTGTSTTITWPASVKWTADTAPSLTDTKTHLFMFVTNDGGITWRGAALVDYTT